MRVKIFRKIRYVAVILLLALLQYFFVFFDSVFAQDLSKTEASSLKKDSNKNGDNIAVGSKSLLGDILVKAEKVKSLMFNEKESKDLNNAINSFKTNKAFTIEDQGSEVDASSLKDGKKENIKSYIYLASILYVNKNNWTVWIGDKKITNKNNSRENEFYITAVDNGKVSVLWLLSISKWKVLFGVENDEVTPPPVNEENQIETRFTLRPNQTFSLNENKIFEGRISVNDAQESPSEAASQMQLQ